MELKKEKKFLEWPCTSPFVYHVFVDPVDELHDAEPQVYVAPGLRYLLGDAVGGQQPGHVEAQGQDGQDDGAAVHQVASV